MEKAEQPDKSDTCCRNYESPYLNIPNPYEARLAAIEARLAALEDVNLEVNTPCQCSR